MKTSNKKLFL